MDELPHSLSIGGPCGQTAELKIDTALGPLVIRWREVQISEELGATQGLKHPRVQGKNRIADPC